MPQQTIEELFTEIKEKGCWVNNLFEIHATGFIRSENGTWQANICSPSGFHDFGKGSTPAEALRQAIDKVTSSKAIPFKYGEVVDSKPKPKPAMEMFL